MFRAWQALGNEGAREGEHVLGNDYHYRRFDRPSSAGSSSAHFEVEELTGIRNIPARSLAGAVGKVGWRQGSDKLLGLMNQKGYKVDHFLERTAVAGMVGFFWLAQGGQETSPS